MLNNRTAKQPESGCESEQEKNPKTKGRKRKDEKKIDLGLHALIAWRRLTSSGGFFRTHLAVSQPSHNQDQAAKKKAFGESEIIKLYENLKCMKKHSNTV